MGLSIRTRLVLGIGLPLLLAYLAVLGFEYHLGRQSALAGMESHLRELAACQAAELDGDIRTAQQVARSTAQFITLNPDLAAGRIEALLKAALHDNTGIFGMCAAFERNAFRPDTPLFCPYFCRNSGGRLRQIDIAAARPDYATLDWYRLAKAADGPVWTEPYFDDRISDQLMCTYSAPFYRDGRFRGLVTVDLLSADLLGDIARVKIGSGYCFLISGRGTFVSHPDAALVMQESIFGLARRQGLGKLAEIGREMVAGKTGTRRISDDAEGEPKWIVYAPVPSAGWSLAAVLPESEVMAPLYARLVRLLALPLAGLAVILAIVFLVSARVSRPIAKLSEAARSLAAGNLDARITGVSGSDEIAQLAATFNTMVGDLKENTDARLREEKARQQVEGELNAAREIQASLLPAPLPTSPDDDFSLYAINAPARLVAGDFFDFFRLDEHRLAIAIADVSGKGLPAAVYMAVARTKLRDRASPDKTPAEVVAELNRSLAEEQSQDMFTTLFFAYYHLLTGELVYVNAGHNPPYIVGHDGRLEPLDPTGPVVAPFPDASFCEDRRRLAFGDTLVVFTDGVTESHSGDYRLFGEQRLERYLQTAASLPVDAVCEGIVEAVRDFSRVELKDDVTVLALRRKRRVQRSPAPGAEDAQLTVAAAGP